jgi:hypothetical protein
VDEHGQHAADLPDDWGSPDPCVCGSRPMITTYRYGPARPSGDYHAGWRPLLDSSLDWGSVSPQQLQDAITTVFCRPPEPGELPDDRELSDDDWQRDD